MGEQTPPRGLRRRRIIERPRLIRALDRSQARVRMLVAAAGYGKTILAEQWAGRDDKRAAWYRARRSAIDVAPLARGLAAAAAEIVPGAGRRLEERLAATQDPGREAVVLAELFAEDLLDWPQDAWVVVDDYQHVCASEASESFVETMVHRSPVRLLIASRERPAWVSGRSILYGDVLEVTQTALSMSADEVDEVLDGRHAGLMPGLLAIANGWPAVIGLASVAGRPPEGDVEVPEALYEFFADEVYRALEEPVRTGLAILGALPLLDREIAAELLGHPRADAVCSEALALGVLDERGGRLELHPLAGAFLEQRARRDAEEELERTARVALAAYRARREWDAAFDVVERFGVDDELETLLEEALDELLNAGRLATLEAWIVRIGKRLAHSAIFDIARAEACLRTGRHMTAQTLAEGALGKASGAPRVRAVRALIVAAKSAHVGSRENEALDLFRRAEVAAEDLRWRREALWGQVMSAAALELDIAHELLAILAADSPRSDPTEVIRLADKRLALGFRFGSIEHLPDARRVAELVPEVEDPFARCSFRCTYSCALNLAAYYQDGLGQARLLLEDADTYRIDFALPYGHLMAASALAGLRDFATAHVELDDSAADAERCNDAFGMQAVYSARVRLLLQECRIVEACALEPPDLTDALPGMRGEVMVSRALALACLGRLAEARALAEEAVGTSTAIEVRVLTRAVAAVSSMKARDPGFLTEVENLVEVGFGSGGVDLVVTAYRAAQDLLSAMLGHSTTAERTVFLLARAGDEALARELGQDIGASLDPVAWLSVREKEVYDLVCEGLSNAEIGRRLFISEATVKVHVHHVFDKLGIRSRNALALNAARRRSAG